MVVPTGGAVTAIVARTGIFQTVDPTAVAALMTHLQPVHFSRRQQIYGEGEPGDQLYIVTSGKVKLGRRSSDGRSHLLAIAGPSHMFGELSIFDPGPRTATATSVTEVDAVTMDRNAFRAWVADRPEIAERLLWCWPGDGAAPTTTCRTSSSPTSGPGSPNNCSG